MMQYDEAFEAHMCATASHLGKALQIADATSAMCVVSAAVAKPLVKLLRQRLSMLDPDYSA